MFCRIRHGFAVFERPTQAGFCLGRVAWEAYGFDVGCPEMIAAACLPRSVITYLLGSPNRSVL